MASTSTRVARGKELRPKGDQVWRSGYAQRLNDGLDSSQGLLDRVLAVCVAVHLLKLRMINADRGCGPPRARTE